MWCIVVCRYFETIPVMRGCELREATIPGVTRKYWSLAQVLTIRLTLSALTASLTEPWDAYDVADF
jgi:hypothetical protein